MMQPVELYLVRHAHAGDREDWTGPDELRPLTDKGRRQSERLGELLASVGLKPDAVVSSPKVRARQTAEIVAKALDREVRLDDRLGEGLDLPGLAALLTELDARRVMLFGHDPDFSLIASALCGGDIEMRKGALARIDIAVPQRPAGASLRWLVPPDLLKG